MKKIIILLLGCVLVVACSDSKRYAPKEGRLSVFDSDPVHQASGKVAISKAVSVQDWPQPFQNAQNKLSNILTTEEPTISWKSRLSKASKLTNRSLPTPLIFADAIYTLDSAYTLTKTNAQNGEQIWQQKLAQDKQGLSLTYANKKLFALSSDGLLTATDEDGNQLWQKDFKVATRAALLADRNTLCLITAQNQLVVINAKNGHEIWRYQTTKPQTWLTNMAPPAKSGNIIVAPFATGEVIAFDTDSGMMLWAQMMIGNRPKDLIAIPQIVAAPVIENNTVYLAGNANLIGAYDLKTGATKWTFTAGTTITPIISGNTIFIVTNENQLIALDKKTGKLFWQKELAVDEDLAWQNMLLLNDELVLMNTEQWTFIDPKTGDIQHTQDRESATLPVFESTHMLLLNDKMKAFYY